QKKISNYTTTVVTCSFLPDGNSISSYSEYWPTKITTLTILLIFALSTTDNHAKIQITTNNPYLQTLISQTTDTHFLHNQRIDQMEWPLNLIVKISVSDSYHFSSYNSDTISWPNDNKNKLDKSNKLNDLNSSNISENIHDLDIASNSSFPDQALPCNIKIKDKDGLEKEYSNNYGLTTGTGNLKSHLRQVHRILPPEENNNNSCTVYTIQLALGDGFDIIEVSNLINKAKILNSYAGSKDKYHEKLHKLQAELNSQHQINLFQVIQELNEFAKLLYPFAQAISYIGECQYPMLGIMIPTLIKLSRHLREFYPTITSQVVKACCGKINQSMLSRWSEPSSHSLIAAFLDLRFKKMNYITFSKKEEPLLTFIL
ncbi:11739_t:CDS:2, partial [Gigaspora margarita]